MVDFRKHLSTIIDMAGATCPNCASAPLESVEGDTQSVICRCGYVCDRMVPRVRDEADAVATESVNGQQTVSSCTYQASDETAKGDPTVGREPRALRELPPYPSRVAVSLGLTKSLGGYEFARMDVTLEDYCDPTKAAREARFEELKAEGKAMISSLVARIDAGRK